MNKILHIIRREYITRVRKKSFIIMTIIGPLLFGALMIAPYKLASLEDRGEKVIAVVELDEQEQPVPENALIFKDVIPSNENLRFVFLPEINKSTAQQLLELGGYYGVLILDHSLLSTRNAEITFYSRKQPSMGVEMHMSQAIENFLFDKNLEKMDLSPEMIKSFKTKVLLKTSKMDKDGGFREQKLVNLKRGIGYAAGFLIYFFIFLFGSMVMRGVIEEKTNRVIEVIITSVRPFQLMMGKIIGIALVGLTQFLAWIILTVVIYQSVISTFAPPQPMVNSGQMVTAPGMTGMVTEMSAEDVSLEAPAIIKAISSIKPSFYLYVLGTFLFYFIFGYLLYGSLFAAIGSAVDNDTDTQQFMLPVTIPLILSIIVMVNAITNPEGQLVFWFSIIPFTSPVVMMARIPFNPPLWELLLSMGLLFLTFIGMTWLAGKIYRTGILMYGKKVNYRELIKWIRYKA